MTTIRPAFVLLLGALTMLPPLSIDVSLPGLPAIAHSLHAPGATIAWTLSVFVFAFGVGQLVLGPLSDRYGRRPVLIGGLAGFALLAVACALATNVYVLVVLRFAQGLAACAGTVCARAVAADVATEPAHATKLQAYMSVTNSLAPILAPMLGVAILAFCGWRWLYGALAFVGVGLAVAVAGGLRETSPKLARGVIAGYTRVFARPRTVIFAGLIACAFAAYFALISSSSLVLERQLHLTSALFAAAFAANALATMGGSFVAARCAVRVRGGRLLGTGVVLMLAASIATLLVNLLAPSAIGFTATMATFAFCYGLTVPGAFASALACAGPDAGSASAVLGSMQMIGGAAGSALAAALPFAPAVAVGCVVAAGGMGAFVFARLLLEARDVVAAPDLHEIDERQQRAAVVR